jgi:protease PrsW
MDITPSILLWAFVGGIVPALVWLWFWLKEDSRHPEPKRLIVITFIAGMLVVPVAYVLEQIANFFTNNTVILFSSWAAIEEILKYAAAYIVAFRKECLDKSLCLDEAIDPMIYMITAALGFSAVENMLFLIVPLAEGEPLTSFITGNLRFLGATMLHVVASASIGVAMGFAFYRKTLSKKLAVSMGIFTAIVLHALFNLSIINSIGSGLFIVFGVVWIGTFILLIFFEKIKHLKNTK